MYNFFFFSPALRKYETVVVNGVDELFWTEVESEGNLSRRNNRAAGVPKKSPIGADEYDPATSVYNAAAAAAAATAAPHLHAQASKKDERNIMTLTSTR